MKSFLLFVTILILAFSIPYILGIGDGVELKNKTVIQGKVTKKNYKGKSASNLEVTFQDTDGRKFKSYLTASDPAISNMPIDYPFYIEYNSEDPSINRVLRFKFPKEAIADSKSSVMGKVKCIEKASIYGLNLMFKGYWEIYYDYYVNNTLYKGLIFSKEEPKQNVSEDFWVSYSKQNPKISYIELNNPFSDDDIIDMIRANEISPNNLESILTNDSKDTEIIGEDTIQVLYIEEID